MQVKTAQDHPPYGVVHNVEAQRHLQVRGSDRVQVTTNDEQLRKFLSDRPSNRGGVDGPSDGKTNPRRGMGGRSSDYR